MKIRKARKKNVKRGRYLARFIPGHPRADSQGYVLEHILIAEHILGESLPNGVEIHHIDENPLNNKPSNLIICQDRSYHRLLHKKLNAFKTCGNANWVRCNICHVYDDPNNLTKTKDGRSIYHNDCKNTYDRIRYYEGK